MSGGSACTYVGPVIHMIGASAYDQRYPSSVGGSSN